MPATGPTRPSRLLFRRRQRLTHARDFQAAYAARTSVARGPLRIHSRPNAVAPPVTRLGLSVGRRVGNAVVRNRVKRMLREAFRLDQRSLPIGLDLVIVAHPHDAAELDEYRRWLLDGARELAERWERRGGGGG